MAKVEPTLTSVQALIASGQTTEARSHLDRMLKREPHAAPLRLLAAQAAASQHDHDAALRHAHALLQTDPKDVGALRVLASVAQAREDHAAATEAFAKLIAINRADVGAACALSEAHLRMDDLAAAEQTLRDAVQSNPTSDRAWAALATLLLATGRAAQAASVLEDASIRLPQDPAIASFLASTLNYVGGVAPERVRAAHERAARLFEPRVQVQIRHENPPDPERTLRIGYLSPDLRKHSVSYFIEPLLRAHDPERFEVHLFSTGKKSDEVTERLRTLGEWHECAGLTDRALNQRVRESRIDILVELSGHTTGHALTALGHRPAPIILSAIGYPHSTGLRAIRARIADAITDPIPAPATGQSAREPTLIAHDDVVRLDRCFLCYAPPQDAPKPTPIDPERPITFGSFNSFQKIGPECIEAWSRILLQLPGSRLVLKGDARLSAVVSRLRAEFTSLGVHDTRIETLNNTATPEEARALYARVDVALDTFPYNGTTTTCESLWMGVPVVAILGPSHVSRVSASLLHAIGAPELIAESVDAYVACAVDLARDRARVNAYRAGLRDMVAGSPLCDARAYARVIEAAYRTLWREWSLAQATPGAASPSTAESSSQSEGQPG